MRSRTLRIALAVLLCLVAAGLLVQAGKRLAREAAAAEAGELAAGVAGQAAFSTATAAAGLPGGLARLVPVAGGFDRPLFITHAGDGSGRLFVVEQGGKIRIVRSGKVLPAPFLDLSARLDESSGERGLLGLAFAPDFAISRRFFVAQTARAAAGPVVRIVRYLVGPDSGVEEDRADPSSESIVLEMADPASNHNGGMLAFGPDGMLWIGTGDGGRGGDPWDNARNPSSLLGKILRLDVRSEPYTIPAGNQRPKARARGEVWARGMRNPWRFSFDRLTGEIWIGDVGQNAWEEIDVADSKRAGPLHFGWKTMEGFHCFEPRRGCDATGLELPIHEYGHDAGCSVTGGYVYRGRAIPALVGQYLFSDFCTGTVWALARDGAGKVRVDTLLKSGFAVSSFGEDEAGEIYLCDYSGGRILRLAQEAR